MGRVVTLSQLTTGPSIDGVVRAAITSADVKEMAAECVRIAPGKSWTVKVPKGSDCYLFVLAGSGSIACGDRREQLAAQTFATLQEGAGCDIANSGDGTLELVAVLAPPHPDGRPLAGFDGTLRVATRAGTPIVDVPEQKKRRVYFVGHGAAHSERGHAMIVIYEKDTVTGLHHHPNAESMFVPLDGALQFTVNGKRVPVAPGQVAYFGMHDTHGLRVADGFDGASSLEFHIPAAFTTVRE